MKSSVWEAGFGIGIWISTVHLAPVTSLPLILASWLPDPERPATMRLALGMAYGLAALCWVQGAARARATAADRPGVARWWLLGAGLLALLGANKVFLLRAQGEVWLRTLAQAQGWYDHRQPVQILLAVGLPVAALSLAAWWARGSGHDFVTRHRLAVLGGLVLLLYLALRQSQEWKPLLGFLESLHYRDWRFALEVIGLVLVVVAPWRGRGRSASR